MTQAERKTKRNRPKTGVNKEVIRIIEKNLRRHREILESLAKL